MRSGSTPQTGTVDGMAAGLVRLFLCGDAMLGRGAHRQAMGRGIEGVRRARDNQTTSSSLPKSARAAFSQFMAA